MDIKRYLARFNASHLHDLSLHNLTELQSLHMQYIPFENLDVIRKVPIYLNLRMIYDKVVNHKRGGFCYELNGLFHWLLTELGYDAHMISATVKRPNGIWARADTHAAILVYLDQTYLVDVGFGDSTILPIPLSGMKFTDVSGTYHVDKFDEHHYEIIQERKRVERILYRFNTDKKDLVDFHEGCIFNQVSKDSSFTHADVVTQATPTGRITLSDQLLTITKNGMQTKSDLTQDEKIRVLLDSFRIQL